MNQRLGSTAREEIRTAMRGLVGASATAEAERLAEIFDVTTGHIYRMTADERHGTRKRRSDAGKRKFDLVPGTDTFEAASLVIGGKLDPDEALRTAIANGHTDVPTLATMQRLLREKNLNKKRRNSGRRSHRRFEAEAPLDLIQIDCTALKIRWHDIKTRRIMRIDGVDKNHPQMDAGKVRVWQILAVDDHSRRRFLRYVATSHITSRDMVLFCCQLFCEWGLPVKVYTDNGPEFKGFFKRASKILESIPAIRESGGYEHFTHAPGNPQASGKVEVGHKWAEKMDRYIGLAEQRGIEVTFEKLDQFADAICRHYNEVRVHRETGQTPMARWFGTRVTARMLPAETIRAALLFDEAERTLTDTWTVRVGKLDYRIPSRDEAGNPSPFKVGMKLTVIVPHELDQIFVTLANGDEYEVAKTIATADVAGDMKSAADSGAERLAKELRKHHADRNREAKELQKTTGEVYQVPFFNHEVAVEDTNIKHFPHREVAITAEQIAEVSPVRLPQYQGKNLEYWQAVTEYSEQFAGGKAEAKEFFLGLFPDTKGSVAASDIETAIENRFVEERKAVGLRAVS